jgi:phage repressor protein C with HTH and peptisase S24 domain
MMHEKNRTERKENKRSKAKQIATRKPKRNKRIKKKSKFSSLAWNGTWTPANPAASTAPVVRADSSDILFEIDDFELDDAAKTNEDRQLAVPWDPDDLEIDLHLVGADDDTDDRF